MSPSASRSSSSTQSKKSNRAARFVPARWASHEMKSSSIPKSTAPKKTVPANAFQYPILKPKLIFIAFHVAMVALSLYCSNLTKRVSAAHLITADDGSTSTHYDVSSLFLHITSFYWNALLATHAICALLYARFFGRTFMARAQRRPLRTNSHLSLHSSVVINFLNQVLFGVGIVCAALYFVLTLVMEWNPAAFSFTPKKYVTVNAHDEWHKGTSSTYFMLFMLIIVMTANIFSLLFSIEEFIKMLNLKMMETWKSLGLFNAMILGATYWGIYGRGHGHVSSFLEECLQRGLKNSVLKIGALVWVFFNLAFVAGLYIRRFIMELNRDYVKHELERLRKARAAAGVKAD